jgi:hypothetical protein
LASGWVDDLFIKQNRQYRRRRLKKKRSALTLSDLALIYLRVKIIPSEKYSNCPSSQRNLLEVL